MYSDKKKKKCFGFPDLFRSDWDIKWAKIIFKGGQLVIIERESRRNEEETIAEGGDISMRIIYQLDAKQQR